MSSLDLSSNGDLGLSLPSMDKDSLYYLPAELVYKILSYAVAPSSSASTKILLVSRQFNAIGSYFHRQVVNIRSFTGLESVFLHQREGTSFRSTYHLHLHNLPSFTSLPKSKQSPEPLILFPNVAELSLGVHFNARTIEVLSQHLTFSPSAPPTYLSLQFDPSTPQRFTNHSVSNHPWFKLLCSNITHLKLEHADTMWKLNHESIFWSHFPSLKSLLLRPGIQDDAYYLEEFPSTYRYNVWRTKSEILDVLSKLKAWIALKNNTGDESDRSKERDGGRPLLTISFLPLTVEGYMKQLGDGFRGSIKATTLYEDSDEIEVEICGLADTVEGVWEKLKLGG